MYHNETLDFNPPVPRPSSNPNPNPHSTRIKTIRIGKIDYVELSEQIQALQRAFAHERGENHRFREAVRIRLGLSEGGPNTE